VLRRYADGDGVRHGRWERDDSNHEPGKDIAAQIRCAIAGKTGAQGCRAACSLPKCRETAEGPKGNFMEWNVAGMSLARFSPVYSRRPCWPR
jgi:hypothetical protein